MDSYLIKDTTKAQRIELIKQWQEPEDGCEGPGIDLWDFYNDYINGEKEIAEINAEFANRGHYVSEILEEEQPVRQGCGMGYPRM